VEKRTAASPFSRAIGITPPSLAILRRLGLDQSLIAAGIRVEEAHVSNGRRTLGWVRFDSLPEPYRFILAIPQSETTRLLAASLTQFPHVDYRTSVELVGLTQDAGGVHVELRNHAARTEDELGAQFVVGCDGRCSTVRELGGFRYAHFHYRPQFVMADFDDQTGLGQQAHLFFTPRGSAESFPLPGGQRRWIVLADISPEQVGTSYVARRVLALTGFDLTGARQFNQLHFQPERLLCVQYYDRRVVLCGDAAHVMSPIGGQGMNTGFADAQLLARVLIRACRQGAPVEDLFREYEHHRRKAFRVAAARAARGMWLGTRTGCRMSIWRDWLIESVLLRPPVATRLPAYFAMLTIPQHAQAQP
jgi:2-polyprenyl-6-methoxyphenol hydroxylase-like FAD-dependent oxidoreductase